MFELRKKSLDFIPKIPIGNKPALVQIMAWRLTGDKPLSELMMVYCKDCPNLLKLNATNSQKLYSKACTVSLLVTYCCRLGCWHITFCFHMYMCMQWGKLLNKNMIWYSGKADDGTRQFALTQLGIERGLVVVKSIFKYMFWCVEI